MPLAIVQMWTVRHAPSVAPVGRPRRPQLACALVTEKVVARDDVIDLQALCAGEAFADVALEQALVVDDVGTAVVAEHALGGDPAAGLAVSRRFHNDLTRLLRDLRRHRRGARGDPERGPNPPRYHALAPRAPRPPPPPKK